MCGVLVEDFAIEIASRPNDGRLFQLVELVKIRHLKDGVHIPSQCGLLLNPDWGHVVHPDEIPRRVRPRVQLVLPTLHCSIVLPLLRTVAQKDEMVAAIKLPVSIVDHLDGHRHQIQRPRQGVVEGKRISAMPVDVDPPGINGGRIEAQRGHQSHIHLVKPGLGGCNAVPLPLRERTVLRPIVVELGRQSGANHHQETCQPPSP